MSLTKCTNCCEMAECAVGGTGESICARCQREAIKHGYEPQFETITATAPSHWASYLINGDSSGMDDAEEKAADDWIESIGAGAPTGCEDAGFIAYHDARAFCPLAADCQTYTFLRRVK